MKILLLIFLGIVIYHWFRKYFQDSIDDTRGQVHYYSPDEFNQSKGPEKDITRDTRIVEENDPK